MTGQKKEKKRKPEQIKDFTFKTFYCKGGFLKNVT